jgi:hypothetical protein
MIKQGFESLDKALEARMAAKATGSTVSEYSSQTETEFAKTVAKDVAGGLTSVAEVRMLMYIIPVGVVALIIALALKGCGR